MKPVDFDYFDPVTVDEALSLLPHYGDEAKLLAGGQSLVPLLALRLARPRVLVDLNRIGELSYIRQRDGALAIGAMTRQRAVETSGTVRERCPLLTEAVRLIGHPTIRNRGTIGGNLAHADPASELPAVIAALDGELVARSARAERVIPARDFFVTALTTALQPGEILTEVRVPAMAPGAGWAFEELTRRHGDFAVVGVAAVVEADAAGRVSRAAIALTGVGGAPVRARRAEQSLVGRPLDVTAAQEAGRLAAEATDAQSDIHASADYRKAMAQVHVKRGLLKAWRRAGGGGS
jgi:CO/xanthine dehydrogenase FAD-binding subunit